MTATAQHLAIGFLEGTALLFEGTEPDCKLRVSGNLRENLSQTREKSGINEVISNQQNY